MANKPYTTGLFFSIETEDMEEWMADRYLAGYVLHSIKDWEQHITDDDGTTHIWHWCRVTMRWANIKGH